MSKYLDLAQKILRPNMFTAEDLADLIERWMDENASKVPANVWVRTDRAGAVIGVYESREDARDVANNDSRFYTPAPYYPKKERPPRAIEVGDKVRTYHIKEPMNVSRIEVDTAGEIWIFCGNLRFMYENVELVEDE